MEGATTMTRDDIFRMSHEAGLKTPWDLMEYQWKFAALVAAAEREACAKVAESYEPRCDACPGGVSNAIRARRET